MKRMKKWFFMAAAALAFTACIDTESIDQETQALQPGFNIYRGATNQHLFSLAPANGAVRLAMLVAEAARQSEQTGAEVTIDEVTYDGKRLKEMLFGATATVEKVELTPDKPYDYRIVYRPTSITPGGYYLEGELHVATNGAATPADTDPEQSWTVFFDEFKAHVRTEYGSTAIHFSGGETDLYRNGDDTYSVDLRNFVLNVADVDRHSDWSGSITLTFKDPSLAYSVCKGEKVSVTGYAEGPTYYTFSSTGVATQLRYEVEGGQYSGGTQIIGGEERCSLTGYADFDTGAYPARDVKIVWGISGNYLVQTVTYNGVTKTF